MGQSSVLFGHVGGAIHSLENCDPLLVSGMYLTQIVMVAMHMMSTLPMLTKQLLLHLIHETWT